MLANVTISHPSCWKISSAFNPATLCPSHWQQAASYSHPTATMLTTLSPLEKWPKTPPIWLQKAGINGPLLSQQRKVRFQHILHFQKHIHTPRKPESRSSSPTTQKQPQNTYFHPLHTPKITIIHTTTKTSSFFSFSCLLTTRKRQKFKPSLLLKSFGQEVKFCWYNFSLYHFHFLFYSIFIILVSSSCFHHPFRIIMHYFGFWLW